MAARLNKVFIPFEPLLEKITAWLQFPPPIYAFADADRNNVCVRINGPNSASRFLFYGGDASTAAESRERAAQKGVKKLIARFRVNVGDFTSDRVKMFQLCMKMFRHKCAELLLEERGIQDAGSGQGPNALMESVHVTVNYVQFLGIVMRKTGASITPIETTWVESRGFISWVMVTCPRTNTGIECIFSDPCPEIRIAEQRVAKKTIFFLACKYNLEIVDANFGVAAKISRECCLIREKFMVLKEHLRSLKQAPKQIDNVFCIPDEGHTAAGDDSQVPVTNVVPQPPVKRKKTLELAYVKDVGIGTSNGMTGEFPELENDARRCILYHSLSIVQLLLIVMDYQTGSLRLSKKSCHRLNQAAQKSSQSELASSSASSNSTEVSQGIKRRISKKNRTITGHSEVQGHSVQLTQAKKNRSGNKKKAVHQDILAAAIDREVLAHPLELPVPDKCYKCSAKKFAFESLHFCCGDGEIKIAAHEYPPELARLFTSQEEDAIHFRTYARLYNNLFAFSSIGGNYDANTYKGIYVFKLHGQLYHFVPDLLPESKTPKYLQLYFYDGQHESENRLACFPELRHDVIDILMHVSLQNPYAAFFRSLKDRQVTIDTTIVLNRNTVLDQRVYNAPAVDDVAVIWPENASSSKSLSPHIMVSGKSNKSHRIYHNYGCYDPLQYPLLFPRGECGWTQGLKKKKHGGARQVATNTDPIQSCAIHTAEELLDEEGTRASRKNTRVDKFISPREYYAYKLQIRANNMLLRAGRCLQQYMVDMYVKVENTRLDYFRNNQETIRADLYQGILDSIDSGEKVAYNVGRRVILPPTFLGGPRDMKRRYLNAMALVQKYGKPDFFVTLTCNANWPEIKAELVQSELAQDRPDLVARIFRAKLLALKKEIMEKKVLGEIAAMIYVVEFQKRGLPHAHFLIILKPQYKLKCPADYDKFVCAEIPSVNDAMLRKIILGHMMHGPCGELNPECACMRTIGLKKNCKNKYPKQYASETTNNKDGYPVYRRRNTGEKVKIRGVQLDNQWVIPYNPYLSMLFDCHLNVEVCCTIKAVKYLYKYVYKGHDKISYTIVANATKTIDEIEQYQSGRWVSPCEAAWRIFSFDLFEMYPPLLPLQVHLPNMQTVHLHSHEKLHTVIANSKRFRTQLTEFFAVNAATEGDRGYLYGEFCEHYRWEQSSKQWKHRVYDRFSVGRLAFVFPAEGERFFLRLLLLNVRSPKSFEDLRTVNGQIYSTFKEAALKLNLIEHDDIANLTLSEACQVQLPTALRRLFATVLMFCQATHPEALWDKYYSHLSEDYRLHFPYNSEKIHCLTVRAIEQYLEAMGKSLAAFGLEHLNSQLDEEFRRTKDIIDALDAPIPEECLNCRSKLNFEQNVAFTNIMQYVMDKKPGAFFIDGPGGTGKTFLYNALYAEVRLMNKIVLPTATSGIAAANIPSGRTAHSRFKIPIDSEASLACDVPKQSSLAALLKESTLIIWDEASMAKKQNIESLDLLLQDLCENKILFGGKTVVFGGDFRQVLPVVPQKTMKEAVETSIVTSYVWPELIKFKLTENIRAREDISYSAFLLALGNGDLQDTEAAYVQLPIVVAQIFENKTDLISDLTRTTFPEISQGHFHPENFTEKAILTTLNDDVDSINSFMINSFPGEPVTYKSFDTMLNDTCNVYPTEFINSLCPGGMSPHELTLKQNCPVILLRNLLPSSGLCNGTRLICKRFFPNVVQCVIAIGHYKGEEVFIHRINLRPSGSTNYPFQFERKQFPIKLSFAMTVNKSQGQTLNQVSIYLPQPCFSHGQLYVALSRAKKAKDVHVFSAKPPEQHAPKTVKNLVSFEILRLAGIANHCTEKCS